MILTPTETPYFLFKAGVLKKNFKEFNDLCQQYLKDYRIAYSVKTNSFLGVITTLHTLDSGFEIASLEEMNLIGKKKETIFNGPSKTEAELIRAVKEHFLIHVDSLSELERLLKILDGKKWDIGVRISLNRSKFGVDESHLDALIQRALTEQLTIVSLHFHSGTQLTLNDFEDNLSRVYTFLKKFFMQYPSLTLTYVDIGGGFPDRFRLKNLGYTLADYFQSIVDSLGTIKDHHGFAFILEPGRTLVSDTFDLITRVQVIKEHFDETYAFLDAGINLLPKQTLSQFSFSKISDDSIEEKVEKRMKKKEYILGGPLLFNNDILGRFRGILREGDLIRVRNVGAYCYNLAWEISYKKPGIVVEE